MNVAGAASIERCPVCETGESSFFKRIDGYDYLQCAKCGSLHIDNATLVAIDAGKSTRIYDASYWRDELIAARERAQGEGLVRAGEAIILARRPVLRFLDVGSGPGYLLDALAQQFPQHAGMFHGVELYPPEQYSSHPNYHVGDVGSLLEKFDAGVCIEVIEHLTPTMLTGLARNLARVSEPDTLWLFNTGMPELVLQQDPAYLDPSYRGHIVSYSLDGLRHLFEPHGFWLSPVPGKNYVFMAEYLPGDAEIDFDRRVREPLSGNLALLKEAGVIRQAVSDSMHSSICEEQLSSRTLWVQSLQNELARATGLLVDLQSEHQSVAAWAQSLDAEIVALRASHVELQSEHRSVAVWAQSLDAELGALRGNYATLQAEHDRVTHSRSWMLTRPLRSLAAWWRRCRLAPSREDSPHEPH